MNHFVIIERQSFKSGREKVKAEQKLENFQSNHIQLEPRDGDDYSDAFKFAD